MKRRSLNGTVAAHVDEGARDGGDGEAVAAGGFQGAGLVGAGCRAGAGPVQRGDVDGTGPPVANSTSRRGDMAQCCVLAGPEKRSNEVGRAGDRHVPDCIDAGMDPVQPPMRCASSQSSHETKFKNCRRQTTPNCRAARRASRTDAPERDGGRTCSSWAIAAPRRRPGRSHPQVPAFVLLGFLRLLPLCFRRSSGEGGIRTHEAG